MKPWLLKGAVSVCLGMAALLSPSGSQAADVAFVADMTQTGPQGVISTGKLYVSGQKRRVEVSRDGDSLVSITDGERGMVTTLFPSQKAETEQAAAVSAKSAADFDPCAAMSGAECRKLGQELIGDRKTDKWEIRYQQQGMSLTSYQWIDRERRIPLRHEMPGGQRSELRFLSKEKLNGREVEKWRMISSQANKAPLITHQWYDPELRQAVKQELPGGYTSELTNIQVGSVGDALFIAPPDYRKMAMPIAVGYSDK